MTAPDQSLVFLLDCDNTLLDNDALKADLNTQLGKLLGMDMNRRFWELYEEVRRDTDVVNYPVVLERFAQLCPDTALCDQARAIIMEYPFAERLYPDTLRVLAHLRDIGTPAILSDGDPIYQPLKIEHSGLAAAVDERVLIYIHKEDHLDEVMQRWPGARYVAVDDKPRILAAVKRLRPDRFVTVHVRQGHYAAEAAAYDPVPDFDLAGIGDLLRYSASDFWRAAEG